MTNPTLSKYIDKQYFETIEYFRKANEMTRLDFIRSLKDMAGGHMDHKEDLIETIYTHPEQSFELVK